MLIANGYPKNAIIKPAANNIDGIINAFFTAKASERDSSLGLTSNNDFAIQNNITLIRMKSKPIILGQAVKTDYWQRMLSDRESLK